MTHIWWAGVIAGGLWASVAWVCGLLLWGVVKVWRRD